MGLGVLLFVVATVLQKATWSRLDYWAMGWPWPFLETWGPCVETQLCRDLHLGALVMDVGFWIVVACLILLLATERPDRTDGQDHPAAHRRGDRGGERDGPASSGG